jgi:uncharacterized cupredoxin-like copper-binding protein
MSKRQITQLGAALLLAVALAACSGPAPEPLTVALKAQDIQFNLSAITARVGQPIIIEIENAGVLEHSFLIDELSVNSDPIRPGGQATVTFTPKRAGAYTFQCHTAGHAAAGMVGTLTVTP